MKKTRETRKSKRDLSLKFDVNTGKLFVEVTNTDPQFRNAPVLFTINGDDELINLDNAGKAMLPFDKQTPAVQYNVKIKNKGPLQDDQRLAFWY